MSTWKAARKKKAESKCHCSPRTCLRVVLASVVVAEAHFLCRWPVLAHRKPRAENVTAVFLVQACPSCSKPRASTSPALPGRFL